MKYTVENFQKEMCCKPVIAKGQITMERGKIQINLNWTNILTKLIQETGRLVESYASDLLYSLQNVHEILTCMTEDIYSETCDEDMLQTSFLFGLREMGVDNTTQILVKYENADVYNNRFGAEYRQIWKLDVKVTKSGFVSMELYRVSKYV